MFNPFKPTKEKAEALLRRAMQTGDVQPAVSYYRKYVDAEPGDFEAHNDLGVLLLETGLTEEALEHFRRANELEEAAAHWNNEGRALLSLERFEEADEAFAMAERLDPEDPEPAFNRALCLREQEEMAACMDALEAVIAEHADFAPALHEYAARLLDEDRKEDAVEYLERAVDAAPFFGPARIQAVRTLCDLGRYPEATEHLEAISDMGADIVVDLGEEDVEIVVNGNVIYEGELMEGVPGFGE